MSNLFVKYTGILAVICGVSVGLVAAANEGTKDTIAKNMKRTPVPLIKSSCPTWAI